jgi:integrase
MGEGVVMTIIEAFDKFKKSKTWSGFSAQTQRQYTYLIENTLDYGYQGSSMGYVSLHELTNEWAEWLFSTVSRKGVTVAQQTRTAYNAMLKEMGVDSPFHTAHLKAAGKEVCALADILKLLNTAYTTFKYRNIGLILHLTYATGQPAPKIAMLTWDDIDFFEMEIEVDGKRIPIDAGIHGMLEKQQEDFGFQPYVAPSPFPTRQGYVPYGKSQLSRTMNKLKKDAGFTEANHLLNVAEIRRAGLIARMADGATRDDVLFISEGHDSTSLLRMYKDAGLDKHSA